MLYIVNYRVFPKFLLLFHVVSISVFSTGYLVYFLFHIAYFRLLLFHLLLLASMTFSGSRFAYINFSFSCVYKLSFLCSGGLFFSVVALVAVRFRTVLTLFFSSSDSVFSSNAVCE